MSLFGFGKKKESEALNSEKINVNISNVCILVQGCAKCNELEKNTVEALNPLELKPILSTKQTLPKLLLTV